jgi:hypothetical protein
VRTRRSKFQADGAFLSRFVSAYLLAIRGNLENSEGDGNPLAALNIWNDLNFNAERGTKKRWTKADRANDDKPLVDTGKLLASVKVQGIEMVPSEDGRRVYRIVIAAEDYGLEQARGGTFFNVDLGRTKAIRRARNFADMRQGYDFVTKKKLVVPPRPWNRLAQGKIRQIAEQAASS